MARTFIFGARCVDFGQRFRSLKKNAIRKENIPTMPFGSSIKEAGALGLHEKPRIEGSFDMPTQGCLSLVRQKQQKR